MYCPPQVLVFEHLVLHARFFEKLWKLQEAGSSWRKWVTRGMGPTSCPISTSCSAGMRGALPSQFRHHGLYPVIPTIMHNVPQNPEPKLSIAPRIAFLTYSATVMRKMTHTTMGAFDGSNTLTPPLLSLKLPHFHGPLFWN